MCAEALWSVHLADGYPIHWPADPVAWLSPATLTNSWVAVSDHRIAGHVGVEHREVSDVFSTVDRGPFSGAAGFAIVTRLFVVPETRGLGVARLLLGEVRAHARQTARAAMLEVVAKTAAVNMYERLGWQLVDCRQSDWKAPDGTRHPVRIYLEP